MDFGRPNAKIGQKMANGRLLFVAPEPEPADYSGQATKLDWISTY